MSGNTAVSGARRARARLGSPDSAAWTGAYLRRVGVADGACALAASVLAYEVRFDEPSYQPAIYLAFTALLPLLWVFSVALAGGYDPRFIGVGSDEFRRVLNAAVSLTAMVAIASYAVKFEVARGYMVIALPCATLFDLVVRHRLRKRLHRLRSRGACMRRVVAVGHAPAVADLIGELRRGTYHGLSVVGACLAGGTMLGEIAGVPVLGGLTNVTTAVGYLGADTVAVLACPEMNGIRLRELAWDLEKTGTDMCVAAALLDVAGPRTTIRPVAGLPLLHVDHPELAGGKQVLKAVFDKAVALTALILLLPLFAVIMLAVRLGDHGPVFFRQTRVGKDGHTFSVWKFRTMVVDAEQRKASWRRSTSPTGRCSRCARTRGSPRRAPGCAATPSTSSRSCSTWCSGTCPWSARGPRCRPRRPSTATTCGAGSWSSRASPACGRSTGDPTCPGTKRSGSTCVMWRTGHSPWTCRSCGKPGPRSSGVTAPTSL